MGATSSAQRLATKRAAFSLARDIKGANNAFGRRRKNYLLAVVAGNMKVAADIETVLIERLRSEGGTKVRQILEPEDSRRTFVSFLRKGIPLSNALKILLLRAELAGIEERHIPGKPKYRKPEVLRLEMEILIMEYESLRLARSKAKEFGLTGIEASLRKEITAKAQKVAEYGRIFKRRLVE